MPKKMGGFPSLLLFWAIAQGVFLSAVASPVSAQWWSWDNWQQPTTTHRAQVRTANPINRLTLERILQLGQQMNGDGVFTVPIPLSVLGWRTDLSDGWLLMPMEWQPDDHILVRISAGRVVQIDYQIGRWGED